MMKEEGSTSVVVLGLLLFLTVAFIGTGFLVNVASRRIRLGEESHEQKRELVEVAEQIAQMIAEDPSPQADSSQDPVWQTVGDFSKGGVQVDLKDLSSYIGLNWVRKELLDSLDVLQDGMTAQDLQQFREDTGIHLNLREAFEDFIAEEDVESAFSAYTYFNINICDEFVLRKLYHQKIGDEIEADLFRRRIQQVRKDKKTIDSEQLKTFLTDQEFELLYPVLNAEPVMNVHFVAPETLRGLFSHYGIPLEKATQLLELRDEGELTRDELKKIIGDEHDAGIIWHYLGNRTWFWQVRIEVDEKVLTWVLAVYPGEEEVREIRVVEEEYLG